MRQHRAELAAFLFLVLNACAFIRQARPDPQALMQADRAFAQATAERRLDGFASFLSGDVMSIRPNSPVVHGKEGLTARWATLLNDPAVSITWKPLQAVISEAGDMGFTVGSYEVTKANGQSRTVAGTGKYVTIWRKQPDGSWKVVFDSGVQDAPPEGAAH